MTTGNNSARQCPLSQQSLSSVLETPLGVVDYYSYKLEGWGENYFGAQKKRKKKERKKIKWDNR